MTDLMRRLAAWRAAAWLSLAAAPTFALMAVVTGIPDGGTEHVRCSGAMVPMYALMSAFHLTPWLRLVSRWTKRRRARPHRVALSSV